MVADVRETFDRRLRIMVNALGGFELRWQLDVPFVWLELPAGWRAANFVQAASTRGIYIRSAEEFALRDGRAPHAVRIAVNAQMRQEDFEAALFELHQMVISAPEDVSG